MGARLVKAAGGARGGSQTPPRSRSSRFSAPKLTPVAGVTAIRICGLQKRRPLGLAAFICSRAGLLCCGAAARRPRRRVSPCRPPGLPGAISVNRQTFGRRGSPLGQRQREHTIFICRFGAGVAHRRRQFEGACVAGIAALGVQHPVAFPDFLFLLGLSGNRNPIAFNRVVDIFLPDARQVNLFFELLALVNDRGAEQEMCCLL